MKGKAKKKSKNAALARTKEGRKLVSLKRVGNYVIHNPSNVSLHVNCEI
jgi:hypothetical protein